MRLSEYLPVTLAVVLGGLACIGAAMAAVSAIESQSETSVRATLAEGGLGWTEVSVDGLQLVLSGIAPDEAARFAAVTRAGKVVDASRIIDQMEVQAQETPEQPDFAVEILRNDDGVSLIGLVPASEDREAIAEKAARAKGDTQVTDLLEAADYPVPPTWDAALAFALEAMTQLPRSKISAGAERVVVTAIADSAAAKRKIEGDLRRIAPDGVELVLNIDAPRPVLAPFTLRFVIDENGAHFDACSADSPETRDAILAAAAETGMTGEASCLIGLGQPSPRWRDAVSLGIAAVTEMKGGSVTFSDADVTLVAARTTRQADFDRIAGRLEVALPEVFSLTALMPEPEPAETATTEAADGPPEFVATRSPEGQVQLRGRLPDARTRDAVVSYARSRFGVGNTEVAARIGDGLPQGWPMRVLASLEALSLLNSGAMTVRPDMVEIRGLTGDRDTQNEISRVLAANLGEDAEFTLNVRYVEALDPVAALPTPEECVARVNTALATRKITFEPGSATLAVAATQTIDAVAEALRDCQGVKMEIGGHTDSQGRESMNERLSQQRADAVLNAIMARRVLTSNLSAKGYGESRPIADNGTEEGREANRRIEFTLTVAAETADAETGADTEAQAEPEAQPEAAPEAGTEVTEGTDEGSGDGDVGGETTDEQN